jgi:ribA/ribD-fused uncharacterized protein
LNKIESFVDEYRWLSNFWRVPVEYEGVTYPTVEHAYQAAKTTDVAERNRVLAAPKPGLAKKAGFAITLRDGWDGMKYGIMKNLLLQKFSDPVMKQNLLDTGDAVLIEGNYWHDNYWGTCTCAKCGNKGKNNLGKLIMEIRDSMTINTDTTTDPIDTAAEIGSKILVEAVGLQKVLDVCSMADVYTTNVLEMETSRGNTKYWQGHVVKMSGEYYTRTSYWQSTKDGLSKKQFSEIVKIAGKNIGRANETTPEQQARSEVESAMNKQIDKGYHADGEVSVVYPLPMLAHKYKEKKHTLVGKELGGQPKIDGSRQCYSSTLGVMWSRQGKPCKPQICHHLQFDTQGYIVDGELVLPKPYTFQQTMSASKRFQIGLSPKLEFRLFDIVDVSATIPFRERLRILKGIVESCNNSNVKLLPTYKVSSEEDIIKLHDQFVAEGNEGIIIRDMDGMYTCGYRNASLQKYKVFEDDEFEIVDISEGKGKNEGVAKFICKTKDGKLFAVEYNAPLEERKDMYLHQERYIGKMLTVRYQEMSDDGIPRFNKGIGIRDKSLQG